MVVTAYERGLFGRRRECAELDRLLDAVRDGHSAVLVVHGDPGVGKTALLQQAADAGKGFRVIRAAGVEGEMELDYRFFSNSARHFSGWQGTSRILSERL